MNPDSGHVLCCHCHWSGKETIGKPCTDLLNDVANQSLCLKFQGWTKAKKNWRCPDCTILYCSGFRQISPQLLRCRHGQPADSAASPCMDVPSPPAPAPDSHMTWAFTHQAPPSSRTATKNRFDQLPVSHGDPEDDMLQALVQLAGSNAKTSYTMSQQQR